MCIRDSVHVVDTDGSCDPDNYGCTNPEAANYNADALFDDGSCIFEGCTEPAACNYWAEANADDGSCDYACYGCTDSSACNYDVEATIADDSCDFSCYGCTNPCAPNHDIEATLDDGSCLTVVGCMDIAACNYDACADATGPCEYLDQCGVCGGEGIPDGDCDCNGNVLDACGVCGGSGVDVDGDGLCDDVDGCTDTAADNYDAQLNPPGLEACEYIGCTDPNADNYDAQANVDAGCLYTGCTDPEADNYDPQANVAGECIYGGCTDPNSCNYDPDAVSYTHLTLPTICSV